MLLCACVYGVKSEISQVRNFAWHQWFSLQRCCKRFCFVFINQRCAECVCLYATDFVSSGKNTLLLYVTVCEKVVPRLNKHDDVIEWNFMKIPPPPNEELVAPLILTENKTEKRPRRKAQVSRAVGVVLNYCFESRMQFLSTLCVVLNSLLIKSLIFCVTDFVL